MISNSKTSHSCIQNIYFCFQVSIEEYGGLDSTLKVDGEKHVFAIITTHSTECFATESLATLRDWVAIIQEYFGKGQDCSFQNVTGPKIIG